MFENIANFNGKKPMIDINDAVMVIIDPQSGLFQLVEDMPRTHLRTHIVGLARTAHQAGIPAVTTASVPQGPNGPLIPEIKKYLPEVQYIPRRGEINAWDVAEFREAIAKTGRKTLIMSGTVTSVCLALPAISAVADGYKVFAVVDASGTYSKMSEEISVARMVQAGVVPVDTAMVTAELQKTWHREDDMEWADIFSHSFLAYRELMESYARTVEAVKNDEPWDSKRED